MGWLWGSNKADDSVELATKSKEEEEEEVISDRIAKRNVLLEELKRNQQRSIETRKPKEINWFLMTPLLFAPALPLIRITLRKQPKVRDIAFRTTLGAAFLHSAALAMGFYNIDQ
mmetsp:Transcript_17583/g.31001  ORF Transcript_17583/g.31001 Transcript_17583/m.31001 type:complete len:115 (+) Transcript_17583:301-645(+)|eukprot:CAMPEP_0184541212 /NCGR_PEP_ID=MMETSP0199_2-20130426/1250_1 /TAXON_ID=1112570 /ORGANISM="Thraustochytrium sp., Strain LLF1b" /LENGTH=114 /DNA_ID=CAMNT_0026934923 /DNA_START=288 /DNA_END=632 /DNA_ORIENTATION=+